ncbi:MAG: bifunctional oligoribonuclease/PAP phosphatase NrnA [Clostridiales bacterium]|nr:bifunctional oligoribonuclease/PAP phosphatase NrnA [Clostridiales bacterium]
MTVTISETVSLLKEHDKFIIITHIRPDGDTIGSGSALCYALRKSSKTAYLYNNTQFEDSFPWVAAPYIAPEGFEPEYTVAVDLADESLFPEGFKGKVNLCIDHHASNTMYAENILLCPEKASCGEVVMEIVKELNGGLDPTVADLLYIAVSTDTGCFLYGNTTGDTLRAAAELCDAGASNTYLNKILFRTSSKARLTLEAMIFSSLRYYHDGRTVIAIVTKEMLKEAGATEKDCQDIAALPGRVEGAFSSAVIKEVDENNCKISLRTNGMVNANKVCAKFGGGGHKMASGCSMNKNCFEAAEILANAIAEEFE